ncbi:MAG: urease [Frankiales bacterium]|nr:urease [Frankiales bacterium]
MKAPSVALVLLAAACSSSSSPKATPADGKPTLPVVKESFTSLPCDDATNLGEQGCLEKDVLAADVKVNELVKGYWDKGDAQNRAALARSERAWFAYRSALCSWEGDQYRDGSILPVVVAQCLSDVTTQHAKDLTAAATQG